MTDEAFLVEARRVLMELEAEMTSRIESNEASTESPQINSAVGRLTYIDAYQQEQMSLHARRQLQSRLVSIRAALERVKEGTYGKCTKCGQPILPERLEFLPEAPCCTRCNA